MNRFSRISDLWTHAVFADGKLDINVLVVADGDLTFLEFDDLSLTRFCAALAETGSKWEEIKVTTAHRKADQDTGASLPDFKFDRLVNGVPSLHITKYDQVWLFGQARVAFKLDASELDVIREFMNHGGGVFATGDHEDLGSGMCGDIPRVRAMRRWHVKELTRSELPAPARNASTRIDTLREGVDPGFQRADEKDAIPQEIRPKFFVNETRTAAEPHEILARGAFAITILPDHMHEGECVSPDAIKKRAAEDETIAKEFPARSNGETVWPEVVAISSSAGGTFIPGDQIFPVDPRCYIVILAYDGHLVEHKDGTGDYKLGRVVVDASFHHFVNFNLNGFIDDENVPKKEFEIFAEYYQNTLHYLLPSEKQRRYFLRMLRALRFTMPLQEDLQDLSTDNWDDVVYAGTRTKEVITQTFSAAHARRCALAMISDLKPNLRTSIEDMVDLWQKKNKAETGLFFLNSDAILIVLLGQAILEVTANLPSNFVEVSSAMSAFDAAGTSFHIVVTRNLQQRVAQLQKRVGSLGQHLARFSEINELEENTMGKCHTETGKRWDSEIDGKSAGSFTVGPEGNGGEFDGLFDSTEKLSGKCREKTGKPHKIRFSVPSKGHLYVGVFVSNSKIEGLRFSGVGVDDLDGGDEDWVAVKVGT